jgi:hypothetical protein
MSNNLTEADDQNNQDIDLTFIPHHIRIKVTKDRVLKMYKRILKKGQMSPSHYKCLQNTMKP